MASTGPCRNLFGKKFNQKVMLIGPDPSPILGAGVFLLNFLKKVDRKIYKGVIWQNSRDIKT